MAMENDRLVCVRFLEAGFNDLLRPNLILGKINIGVGQGAPTQTDELKHCCPRKNAELGAPDT